MKLYAVMLTHNRYDALVMATDHNISRAGCDVDLYCVDNGSSDERVLEYVKQISTKYRLNQTNEGVSRMQNAAMHRISEDFKSRYDSDDFIICLMGNDIIMPDCWAIKMIMAYKKTKSGLIGIDCLGHSAKCNVSDKHNDLLVTHNVFGTCIFGSKMLYKVGYLCNDFHPYGLEDSDWHHRIKMAGYTNYYLLGLTSKHIGADVGDITEYRKMKDDSLTDNQKVWRQQQDYYKALLDKGDPCPWYLHVNNGDHKIDFSATLWLPGERRHPGGGGA